MLKQLRKLDQQTTNTAHECGNDGATMCGQCCAHQSLGSADPPKQGESGPLTIGYYPGCALHGSSNDYEISVRACLDRLDVGLQELDDWICCGASAAHSINHKLSVALPARNLGIAERDGYGELLAPCPMCSKELLKARQAIRQDESVQREMSEIVEVDVSGSTSVVNLIQVFQRIGLAEIQLRAKQSLEAFRPACYYGCLLTRPPKTVDFDDPEQPQSMETLLNGLGAQCVEWNYKTECCGAGMTMCNEPTVLDLSQKILKNAKDHEANCIVVACPMCHVNLDMKQADIDRHIGEKHRMPVYYLSDLVGLAMGISKRKLGINRHFVKAKI